MLCVPNLVRGLDREVPYECNTYGPAHCANPVELKTNQWWSVDGGVMTLKNHHGGRCSSLVAVANEK